MAVKTRLPWYYTITVSDVRFATTLKCCQISFTKSHSAGMVTKLFSFNARGASQDHPLPPTRTEAGQQWFHC